MILSSDNNPANHKGSIIKYPKLKQIKSVLGYIDTTVDCWKEDLLLEPMDGQIAVTLNHGIMVLTAEQAERVELIDGNLWDDSCENRLQELYKQLKEIEKK